MLLKRSDTESKPVRPSYKGPCTVQENYMPSLVKKKP